MSDLEKKLKEVKDELQEMPKKMRWWQVVLRALLVIYCIVFVIWVSFTVAMYVHSTHPDPVLDERVSVIEEYIDSIEK